jgi:hypothetical protein
MIAALLAAAVLATGQQSASAADVQLAAQHLRNDHPNLFHDLAPATFDAFVSTLEARADSLGPLLHLLGRRVRRRGG